MKKLFILTIMMVALSSQAKAYCTSMKPLPPVGYCAGGWQAVCVDGATGGYEGYWMWICQNRY